MFRRYVVLIASFIRRFFQPKPPEPPERLTGDYGTQAITVELYQSERLTGKNGRSPEEVVAVALANAFDDASVSYDIKRSNPSVRLSRPEKPDSETLREFRDTEDRSVDSRLCLIDAPGGGRGELPGVYAIMGTNNIDGRFDPSLSRRPLTGRARNVRGAIHEVGHTLGGRHKTPILAPAPEMRYSEAMKKQIRHYIQTGNADPTN